MWQASRLNCEEFTNSKCELLASLFDRTLFDLVVTEENLALHEGVKEIADAVAVRPTGIK